MQTTWKPENKKLNKGNNWALLREVCELINPEVSYLNLNYQKRMESLTTRQNKEIRNQTLKTLNWEYRDEAEYTCITKTLEQQKELLKHMYREEEDISQQELLVQLLRKIWKYIRLSNFSRMELSFSCNVNTSGDYFFWETRLIPSSNKSRS